MASPLPERQTDTLTGWLWVVFALLVVAVAAVAFSVAADIGRSRAIATTRGQADDAGTLALAVLRGELEKQRALPVILARDPDVRQALGNSDKHALDIKLEAIARETHTAVIYVLDRTGLAIAASNWREPTSFVGSDYAFRDYFLGAVTAGSAEQFALGTVSNRPGLYITSRVEDGGTLLGVVVVKVEFDRVEADWRALGGQTYVVDQRGVVLLSTITDWRFSVEAPLAPEMASEIRRSLQFGAAPLAPLPFAGDGEVVRGTEAFPGTHVASRTAVPTTTWQLEVLLPVDRAIRDDRAELQALVALVLMPGAALGGFALLRRQRNVARRNADALVKAELERRVAERTAELAGANSQLVDEIAERERAQERLSDAREELAKANRLATLGQISAGVAHEINQPLAALRTYAENARSFLQRADSPAVDDTLGKIMGLTERIGTITEALRGFARHGSGPLVAVDLGQAIDGALMILHAPLRQAGIVPALPELAAPVAVVARRVELEQVLVNLLRNAIEATGPSREVIGPVLAITVEVAAAQVEIAVADRGSGLDEESLALLFTPFRTTKPRGLGLGLVISQDIVTAFGGTLSATSRPDEGSVFTITLKRAG